MMMKLLALCALLCALTARSNSIEAGKMFAGGGIPCLGVDSSTQITLDKSIVFNGESFDSLYVMTNGFVTFGSPHSGPVQPLNTWPANTKNIIAAYWANTEPRCGGITYRVVDKNVEPGTFAKAESDIMRADVEQTFPFIAEAILVVTYENVKPRNALMSCSVEPDNTFQLVLVTNDTHTYALFLYEHLGYKQTEGHEDYAIAAIGTDEGPMNIVRNVDEVSGTEDVDTLPSITGNVLSDDFTGWETGYFIFLL